MSVPTECGVCHILIGPGYLETRAVKIAAHAQHVFTESDEDAPLTVTELGVKEYVACASCAESIRHGQPVVLAMRGGNQGMAEKYRMMMESGELEGLTLDKIAARLGSSRQYVAVLKREYRETHDEPR